MIKTIQGEVEHSVLSMDHVAKKVVTGVELVNRAGESLSSIVRSIDDLNTMVQQDCISHGTNVGNLKRDQQGH